MKNNIIKKILKKMGLTDHAASYIFERIYAENFGNSQKRIPLKDKIWAYKHGFDSETVRMLGITPDNYKSYISIWDYFKLEPIDPITKRLIDGKLVLPYTIGGRFPQYLPKHFCYINEHASIVPMADNYIYEYSNLEDYLTKLLICEKTVAVKSFTGRGGKDFFKIELTNNGYLINDSKSETLTDFCKIISDKYLITEWIFQCKEMDEIWSQSSATLRINVVNDRGEAHVFFPAIRFGTSRSGSVSNVCAGGIALLFNWKNGMYNKFANFGNWNDVNGSYRIDHHPDSGIVFEGKKIPYFEETKKMIDNICSFMPVHSFFGFDIILSQRGPLICEINSQPDIVFYQYDGIGLWDLEDSVITNYFRNKIKEYDEMKKR